MPMSQTWQTSFLAEGPQGQDLMSYEWTQVSYDLLRAFNPCRDTLQL